LRKPHLRNSTKCFCNFGRKKVEDLFDDTQLLGATVYQKHRSVRRRISHVYRLTLDQCSAIMSGDPSVVT
jgi:hypothetical protein